MNCRVPHRAFERLERHELKDSRAVLRGLKRSNALRLPDPAQAVRAWLPDMLDDMVEAPTLYSVTGEAVLEVEDLPTETNYWLVIDDQRFPLTTHAARVFQTGRTYRVYYVHFADATVLMSAEWLTDQPR